MTIQVGFDTSLVVVRLRESVPALRQVAESADLATAISTATVATPSAFVLPAKDVAAPAVSASEIRVQAVDVFFSVIVAVRSYKASALGAAQANELRDIRRACGAALIGWQPQDGFDRVRSVEYHRGERLAYTAATVWWQDIFRFRQWSHS